MVPDVHHESLRKLCRNEPRALFQLTVLQDGRVLATGGSHESFSFSTDSAEIFDPNTGVWSITEPMLSGRRQHAAVLLPNGDVFVAGGDPARYTTELFRLCQ